MTDQLVTMVTLKSCFAVKFMKFKEYSETKENNVRTPTNPLSIGAKEGEILYASYVKFCGSLNKPLKRYFVVRKDFCLYSYASDDVSPFFFLLYPTQFFKF